MKRHLTFFVLCIVFLQTAATLAARDFYVNPEAGNDESTGSRDSPLATAQRAVDLAESGDTIHLQPDDGGFSAHDTCQCWITDGRFWGNDNAVADVNAADTYYKNCEFRESMSYEVLLHGGHHSLENCRIIASSVTAISIHPDGYGAKRPDGTRPQVPVDCLFRNLKVTSHDGRPRRVSLYDATVTIEDSTFTDVEFRVSGAKVKSTNSTHDGQTLTFPSVTR